MFLGHYGLAFAAKRAAPSASLGTLVLAAQFADLVWPLLLFCGVERVEVVHGATPFLNLHFVSYPYSHSLLTQVLFGIVLATVVLAFRRGRREAFVVGLLVPSHWLLDGLAHVPDLPLYPGGAARLGFGLWLSEPLTLVSEFGLLASGFAIYALSTRPRDRVGRWAPAALAAFLAVVYVASFSGGPPPGAGVVAGSALLLWLTPLWAYWGDRHRTTVSGAFA